MGGAAELFRLGSKMCCTRPLDRLGLSPAIPTAQTHRQQQPICSTALNDYLDFPHVGQVFLIEREVVNKRSGLSTVETALGMTSQTPEQACPIQVLATNRRHWAIENSCHYVIDWNFNEDRSRISKGFGPQNVTRLRRFAVGVIKGFITGKTSVAEKMRQLHRNTRLVFEYLRMTENSIRASASVSG